MRKILLGYVLSAGLLASGAAMAQGYQAQPSCDWDCNWGFSGFYDLRDQASLIESQKEGGFGAASTTMNNNGDTVYECTPGGSGAFSGGCAVQSGGTANAIGSQNIVDQSNTTNANINGDGNDVASDQGNTNDSDSSNTGNTRAGVNSTNNNTVNDNGSTSSNTSTTSNQ